MATSRLACVLCSQCENYSGFDGREYNCKMLGGAYSKVYNGAPTQTDCDNFKPGTPRGNSSSNSGGGSAAGLAGAAAVGGLAVGVGAGAAKGIFKILWLIPKGIFLMYKYLILAYVWLWKKFIVPPMKQYASARRVKINELETALQQVQYSGSAKETRETMDGLINIYEQLENCKMPIRYKVISFIWLGYPLFGVPYFYHKEPGTPKAKAVKSFFANIDSGVQKLTDAGDSASAEQYGTSLKKMKTKRLINVALPIVAFAALYTGLILLSVFHKPTYTVSP